MRARPLCAVCAVNEGGQIHKLLDEEPKNWKYKKSHMAHSIDAWM